MGVLDYLFSLLHGHHFQTEHVQKVGPMVRAAVKEVELRHHWLKELEACWPGNYAQIIMKHYDSVSADIYA